MKHVVVVGAGNIGTVAAEWLASTADYRVKILDSHIDRLGPMSAHAGIETEVVDVADSNALRTALTGSFAVLCAVPYHMTDQVAEAASAAGVHYLDLTEDVATTRRIHQLARTARHAVIPQCGLAPGFVSIVAYDLVRRFNDVTNLSMRVGALPRFPLNALKYNLTWSTDGLINEYCEPCDVIVDGARTQVAALEGLEEFTLDGVTYEAFNTSGGLGTLCATLLGRVKNLHYKTIRYPGHAAIVKILLDDLGLRRRRELLKDILEFGLPTTLQDVVIIAVTASGMRDGQFIQETYSTKVYGRSLDGTMRSAIQVTTAGAACAVLDLLAEGMLQSAGLVRQEDIPLDAFLANRFGMVFDPAGEGFVSAAATHTLLSSQLMLAR